VNSFFSGFLCRQFSWTVANLTHRVSTLVNNKLAVSESVVKFTWLVLWGRIAVLRMYMRPIVTDWIAWSVSVSVTVVSPAKTAEPIKMLLGLRTRLGPRHGSLYSIATLCDDLCKNGWTDRDAIWVMDSGEPKEACIRRGPDCPCKGQLLGERTCPGMPDDTLPWDVQKWLNRSICYLVMDLGELRKHTNSIVFTRLRQCALMGRHIGATWRIWCSLVSYYLDHLLNINHRVRHHWCNTI